MTTHVVSDSWHTERIASFRVEGKDPLEVEKELFQTTRIHVTAFNWPNLSGIRITPNIYTKPANIDTFAGAIKNLVA